jgi:hypothetical protein
VDPNGREQRLTHLSEAFQEITEDGLASVVVA